MQQFSTIKINLTGMLSLWFLLCCGTANKTQAPQTTSTTTTVDKAVHQVFTVTNEQRRQRGLALLRKDDRLMTAAQDYAQLMAKKDKLTHNVGGKPLSNRVGRVQYQWRSIGENIAENASLNGQDVVLQQWMQSAGHRSNILSKEFTQIGIGIARADKANKYYYCQIFARPQ